MTTIPTLAKQLQDDVRKIINKNRIGYYKDHNQWTLSSKNIYIKGVERKEIKNIDLHSEISKLQSYKDLVNTLPKDNKYNKRLNKILTTHSMSSVINAQTYIDLVLVNLNDLLTNKPYEAKAARTKFLQELTTNEYEIRLITPVLGLRVGGKIPLGFNTKLIPQNDQDIIKCLDWGLISPSLPNREIYLTTPPMYAGISFLVSTYKQPLVSGRKFSKNENSTRNKFIAKHEWIRNSLQMTFDIHSYEINLGKTIVTANYLAVPGDRIFNLETTPELWPFSQNLTLKRSLTKEMKNTFSLLNDVNLRSNPVLRLACTRLAHARHRKSEEDSFLDLMIACEAFYMSNESDHIDITYKLRIRAAIWYPGTDYSKEDIMQLFKNAYDVRSRIAHGSKLKKINFRGHELTIRELFEIIEKILKASLLKYLYILPRKPISYNHNWESVVINGSGTIL